MSMRDLESLFRAQTAHPVLRELKESSCADHMILSANHNWQKLTVKASLFIFNSSSSFRTLFKDSLSIILELDDISFPDRRNILLASELKRFFSSSHWDNNSSRSRIALNRSSSFSYNKERLSFINSDSIQSFKYLLRIELNWNRESDNLLETRKRQHYRQPKKQNKVGWTCYYS